jgi:hypothetical protein
MSEVHAKQTEEQINLVESPTEADSDFAAPATVPTPAAQNDKKSDSAGIKGRFEGICNRFRMMEINQVGVLCVCGVAAFLMTAWVAPSFDETNIPRDMVSRIAKADANLAAEMEHTATADGAAWQRIGLKFLLGDGVHVNRKRALECFTNGFAAGNQDSLSYIQLLTHTHRNLKDLQATTPTLRKTPADPAKNDVDALWQNMCGAHLDRPQDLDNMRRLANQGNTLAQYVLGYRLAFARWPEHFSSLGVATNTNQMKATWDQFLEGVDLLTHAAEKNFAPAQTALVTTYDRYNSLDGDFGASYSWNMQSESHRRLGEMWDKRELMLGTPDAASRAAHKTSSEGTKEERGALRNFANMEAAESTTVPYLAHAAVQYQRLGDHKAAFDLNCVALGTTRQNLARDIKTFVFDKTCDVEPVLDELATALALGKGVEKNTELSNEIMLTRAQSTRGIDGKDGTYIDQAASWLARYNGDAAVVEELKTRAAKLRHDWTMHHPRGRWAIDD